MREAQKQKEAKKWKRFDEPVIFSGLSELVVLLEPQLSNATNTLETLDPPFPIDLTVLVPKFGRLEPQ